MLNKFDRRGSEDALRDVRTQWRRNHVAFDVPDDEVPVLPTIASQFDDPGVTRRVRGALPGCRAGAARRAVRPAALGVATLPRARRRRR